MAYTHRIKVGDTARTLRQTLTLFGRLLPLTGATVHFIARHTTDSTVYIDQVATVLDGVKALVEYNFTAQDVAVVGLYNYEWFVTLANGKTLTVPDAGSYTLEIIKGVRTIA